MLYGRPVPACKPKHEGDFDVKRHIARCVIGCRNIVVRNRIGHCKEIGKFYECAQVHTHNARCYSIFRPFVLYTDTNFSYSKNWTYPPLINTIGVYLRLRRVFLRGALLGRNPGLPHGWRVGRFGVLSPARIRSKGTSTVASGLNPSSCVIFTTFSLFPNMFCTFLPFRDIRLRFALDICLVRE